MGLGSELLCISNHSTHPLPTHPSPTPHAPTPTPHAPTHPSPTLPPTYTTHAPTHLHYPCSHPPMLPMLPPTYTTHAPTHLRYPCSHPPTLPMLPPTYTTHAPTHPSPTCPCSHPPTLPMLPPHPTYPGGERFNKGKVRVRAHLTLTSPELNLTRMAWTQLDSLYIPAEDCRQRVLATMHALVIL